MSTLKGVLVLSTSQTFVPIGLAAAFSATECGFINAGWVAMTGLAGSRHAVAKLSVCGECCSEGSFVVPRGLSVLFQKMIVLVVNLLCRVLSVRHVLDFLVAQENGTLLVAGSTELLILAVATVADLAALEADQALLLVLALLLDRREPPPNGWWWVPVVVVLGAKDTTLLVVAATAATRMVLLTVASVTPLVTSSLVLLAVAAWRGFPPDEVLRFEPVVESGDARSELGAAPRADPPPQSPGTTT